MARNMKHIRLIIAMAALMLAASSCGISKVNQIRLTSMQIQSINPKSLRSVDVDVNVGVDNPAMFLTIDGLNGKLVRKGEEIGTIDVEPVSLEAKSVQMCPVKASINLNKNVSLMKALGYASSFDIHDYTVDIDTVIKLLKKSKGLKFKFRDKPLSDFFKSEDNKENSKKEKK